MILAIGVTIIGCKNPKNNHTNSVVPNDIIISDTGSIYLLAQNLNRVNPGFNLILDLSSYNAQKYPIELIPDTSTCHSFKFNRLLLGELNKTLTLVKENKSSAKELYLQSGNLSLWVCNLPDKIKSGDTIFIAGYIYDNHGNEKAWGFPTILTKVFTQK